MFLINVIAFLCVEKKVTSQSTENPAPKSREEMLKCKFMTYEFLKTIMD